MHKKSNFTRKFFNEKDMFLCIFQFKKKYFLAQYGDKYTKQSFHTKMNKHGAIHMQLKVKKVSGSASNFSFRVGKAFL